MSNLLSGDGRYQDLLGLNSTSLSVIMDELEVNNSLILDYIDPNKNIVSDANKKLISEDKDTFINTDGNISISQSNRQFTFDLSLGLNGDKNVITDATGGFTTIDQDTILGTTNQVIVNQVGRQFTLSTPQDIATTSDVEFNRLLFTSAGTNASPLISFGSNENTGIRGGNNFIGWSIEGNGKLFINTVGLAPSTNNGLLLGFSNLRYSNVFCNNADFSTQVKIGSNTIDTTIAGHLVEINQDLGTTDNVNFNVITCNEINAGSVSHTSIESDTIHIPFDNTGTKGLFFGTGTTMGFYGYSNTRFGFKINNQDQYFLGDAFRPANDNVKDLGELSNRWKNIYCYSSFPSVKLKTPLVDANEEIKLSDFSFTKNISSSNIVVSRQGGAGNLEFNQINIISSSNNTIGTSSSRWSNIYSDDGNYTELTVGTKLTIGTDYEFSQVSNNLVIQRTGIVAGNIDTNNLTIDGRDIASDGGQIDTLWTNFGALTQTQVGYIQGLDQALDTTANVEFNDIQTTSINSDTIDCLTINTGNGDVECYAMNQAVRTTDDVKFDNLDVYGVGGTTISYASFNTGTPVSTSVEGRLCDVSVSANKYSIKLTGGSSASTTQRYGMRSSSFKPQDYTTIEVIFECRELALEPTCYVGFLNIDATNNSLETDDNINGSHTFKVINMGNNPDRYIERNPGSSYIETGFEIGLQTPSTSTPKAYRYTIQSNGNFTIDFRSSPTSAWQAVTSVGTKNLSPSTNWTIMVWDNNTANSRMFWDVIGTFTTITTGEGTIKTDYLRPYTASTTDDNYVLCEAGNNVKRFIRTRSGASPYTLCGFMISGGDGSNYYNTVNNSNNGVLMWHYNNSLSFSTASEVMRLGVNGDLTIQGSYSPFTGSHISKNIFEVEDGLLLSSADETEYHTIINSNIYTKLSNSYKDKGVIGVAYNKQDELQIVSNGEGGCQVCSEVIDDVVQSPIEIGDFLCSYFDGYATKQDDDILHNYTMAKAIQNYDFTTNYMEFVKDDKTYRKALIAIILK